MKNVMLRLELLLLPVFILTVSALVNIDRFPTFTPKIFVHVLGLAAMLYGIVAFLRARSVLRVLFALMLSVEVFSLLAYGASLSLGSVMSILNASVDEAFSFIEFSFFPLLFAIAVFVVFSLFPVLSFTASSIGAWGLLLVGLLYVCVPAFIGLDSDEKKGNYRFKMLSGQVRGQPEAWTRMEYFLENMALRFPVIKQGLVAADAYHFFSMQASNTSSAWNNAYHQADGRDLLVLGIGESLRAGNMGIYGYERDTTPFLSSMGTDLTVFNSAYAAGVNTWVSVPTSLTKVKFDTHPELPLSVVNLAKDAGYTVYWISNQPRTSHWDFSTTAIASQADYPMFMRNSKDVQSYDSSVVDKFEEVLESSKGDDKRLFILHFFGSHMDFEDQYPPEFEVFSGGEGHLDSYDNSVLYSDSLQQRIINSVLDKQGKYLFFADHGLIKPGHDFAFKHDARSDPDLDSIKVPLFSVGENAFEVTEGKSVSLYYFECIFSQWAGISADELEKDQYCDTALAKETIRFLDTEFGLHERAVPLASTLSSERAGSRVSGN